MARIGLLVPSSNTTVEPEFYRALPRGVTLHTARLFLTRIAPESILRMVEDMETQAKLLASADVDVIVLGATAPSFLNGLGYDRELIAQARSGDGHAARRRLRPRSCRRSSISARSASCSARRTTRK